MKYVARIKSYQFNSSLNEIISLLSSLAKKTMFRMAFHGKYGNVWNALMSVPEVSFAYIGILLQDDNLTMS